MRAHEEVAPRLPARDPIAIDRCAGLASQHHFQLALPLWPKFKEAYEGITGIEIRPEVMTDTDLEEAGQDGRLVTGFFMSKQGGEAHSRLASGLEKLSGEVAQSSQEISALSREVAQLQQAWTRLGERLRTLMARAGELHEDSREALVFAEGGRESDSG